MDDIKKLNLYSKVITCLTFLGVYTLTIELFELSNSPWLLIWAAVTLIFSWFTIKKLLINLGEIAGRIAYSELLKEFEQDKKIYEMIKKAQKELATRRITLH